MTDEERDRISGRIQALKEQSPACLEFVRRLYELGLIPGWRAVLKVNGRKEPPYGKSSSAHL